MHLVMKEIRDETKKSDNSNLAQQEELIMQITQHSDIVYQRPASVHAHELSAGRTLFLSLLLFPYEILNRSFFTLPVNFIRL